MPSSAEKQPPKEQGPNWKPWAAGALGAAGAYGFMRKGKGRGALNRVANTPKKEQSWIGQQVDRILYGADNVLYHPDKGDKITKPKKISGTIMHDLKSHQSFKGDENLTTEAGNPWLTKLRESKIHEAKFIKQHAPEFSVKSKTVSAFGEGDDLLKKLKKQREDFIIKPDNGMASGVGGESFIRRQDIQAYQSNKKSLSKSKRTSIEDMMLVPEEFLYQEDLGIGKGRFSNANREVRVHAIGGKVVPGATSVRGKNWEDTLHQREAEKYFQKFLDKVPKRLHNDSVAWAPDIAFTKNGPKIIELNAGGLDSGLLDPRHMLKQNGTGAKGTATAFSAMRNNLAIYKHMTGRTHAAEAAPKALGYGAATAGGTALAQRYGAKNQEKK